MTPPPVVSVVVPCYNGARFLRDCVASVHRQRGVRLELIAIDDHSRDRTAAVLTALAAERPFTVVRHATNQGLAATYNDGLRRARGAFVLFLHQDCQLGAEDWVARALPRFDDPRVAVVTGRTRIDVARANLTQRAFTFLRSTLATRADDPPVEELTFSEGKCDLFRAAPLRALGGFPAQKLRISGEDQWVSYALRQRGYRILRDNALPFHQQVADGLPGNLRKDWVFGKTQAGLTVEYGLFQLRGIGASGNVRARAVNKLSKLLVAFLVLALVTAGVALGAVTPLLLSVVTLCSRIGYFVGSALTAAIRFTVPQSLLVSLLGVVTDFAYAFGFAYGLLLSLLRRRL